jgi:DNA-binding transcriptional LysR family regulator
MPLVLEAVRAGHGIAYLMEDRAALLLESGEVVRVMKGWSPTFDGSHL